MDSVLTEPWEVGGVVGSASGGAFIDTQIVGISIDSSRYAGGVFGRGYALIQGVEVTDSRISALDDAGGVVGVAEREVHLSDVRVLRNSVSSTGCLGGALGFMYGQAVIEDVLISQIDLQAPPALSSPAAGGVVGCFHGESISNVQVHAAQIRNAKNTGGIVGYGQDAFVIDRAWADGLLIHSSTGRVGGVVGGTYGGHTDTRRISNVWVSGEIHCDNGFVGGIVGALERRTPISSAYSLVNLLASDGLPLPSASLDTGPVVGYHYNADDLHLLESVYFLDTVTTLRNGIGTPRTAAQFASASQFPGFDFSTVWEMDRDAQPFARPVLRDTDF